jgi:hypothetical protein
MSLFLNFFKAWARVQWARLQGYEILAPANVAQWRFSSGCQQCPFFDGAKCDVCGCLAQAKVMISVERCPVGTWGPRWVKKVRNN